MAEANFKALFDAAAADLNYKQRCIALAKLGKSIKKDLAPDKIGPFLASLSTDTFSALNTLTVAKNCDSVTCFKALLAHPSQSVRYQATCLLLPVDAEEAFLSPESNKQLKTWLVRSCKTLPCTDAVLGETLRVFKDPEMVWTVLVNTKDQGQLKVWIEKLGAEGLFPRDTDLAGLDYLSSNFPDTVLTLLNRDSKHRDRLNRQAWSWLLVLAQKRPAELMHKVLVHKGGMKLNPKSLEKRLIEWGWRHHHSTMVQTCTDVGNVKGSVERTPLDILKLQHGIVSSHARPTLNKKIETLVSVYAGLPDSNKTIRSAKHYVGALPDGIYKDRVGELENLIRAFWNIVAELGHSKREEVLTEGIFNVFAKKLPPALAVAQYFRLLQDVEAEANAFRFVQSNVCCTADGEHDELMLRVFERYLLKDAEKEGAPAFVSMFETLLKDAKSMDVIQISFDKLTERLGGATEKNLLRAIVARMKTLDAEVAKAKKLLGKYKGPPPPTMALPTEWIRFIPPMKDCQPYVAFLHSALVSWTADTELLKTITERFGTRMFWDMFELVLAHATGTSQSVIRCIAPVDTCALQGLTALMPVVAAEPGQAAVGKEDKAKKKKSVYFTDLDRKKQDTYNKDVDKRQDAYVKLIREASKEEDPSVAFIDLVAFFVKRLGGEQENVQFTIMTNLVEDGVFALSLWISNLELLRGLYKIFVKARGTGAKATWQEMGKRLVKQSLVDWKADEVEPSEICVLGIEMSQDSLNYGQLFVDVVKQIKGDPVRQEAGPISENAVKWMLQTAVPVPKEVSGTAVKLRDFNLLLQTMASSVEGNDLGAERNLWERWDFVGEQWDSLLACPVGQAGADYLLSGVVRDFCERQSVLYVKGEHKGQVTKTPWWDPLKRDSYTSAVARVFGQISSGDIPALCGADMIVSRIKENSIRHQMTVDDDGQPRTQIVRIKRNGKRGNFDLTTQASHMLSQKIMREHDESDSLVEISTISALLDGDDELRQVQWSIVRAASIVKGPSMDAVLAKVISTLSPKNEGMARCVGRQYPYMNAMLTAQENPTGISDILSPYLELWLSDKETLDARVGDLMKRDDAELFLFFGESFAMHLSRVRQEWLHQCMEKLCAPPTVDEEGNLSANTAEFYHHINRGPSLMRVGLLAKGWYRISNVHEIDNTDVRSLAVSSWHPQTQQQFMEKALTVTNMAALSILPQLEYVEGIEQVGSILEKHPFEQVGSVAESNWTVLQPSGNIKDNVWKEVERRYLEAGVPGLKNAVEDREVDQALIGLGKSDHAFNSLKVLGKYASKFKRAKDALMNAVPNLSPAEARTVIQEVMFGDGAGIALQVAALRLVMDLQVPNPLQLYRVAWKSGRCHRDVAVNILSKLAASTVLSFNADDVRDMFTIFDNAGQLADESRKSLKKSASKEGDALETPAGKTYPSGMFGAMSAGNKDNLTYIAENFLANLQSTPAWVLPFLPDLVGRLALTPGLTSAAVRALMANTQYITEDVKSLTLILNRAMLASKASVGSANSKRPEAELISALRSYASNSVIVSHVQTLKLELCDPAVLRAFVDQMLRRHNSLMKWPRSQQDSEQKQVLRDTLTVWAYLIRKDEPATSWTACLQEMKREVEVRGGPDELLILLETVATHIPKMKLDAAQSAQMVTVARELFEAVLASPTMVVPADPPPGVEKAMDQTHSSAIATAKSVRLTIILKPWTMLVAKGCEPAELQKLLDVCPPLEKGKLAQNIVDEVVKYWIKEAPWTELRLAPVKNVARQTLWWLVEEEPERHLGTLSKLWPKLLSTESDDKDLASVLELFGRYPSNTQCVEIVHTLLERSPEAPKPLRRAAVRWLAQLYPRDAVRLWPKALFTKPTTADPGTTAEDVAELLQLCESSGLDPPELPVKVSTAVLRALAASQLSQARLQAVRVLQEMDLKGVDKGHAGMLNTLRTDVDMIVQASARLAWRTFFSHKDAASSDGGDDGPGDSD